jgi:hypothetical protein
MFNDESEMTNTMELPVVEETPHYYTEEEIALREAAIAAFNDAEFVKSCNEET